MGREFPYCPDPERVAAANMTAFRERVNSWYGRDLEDYDALYFWSITEPASFWEALWRFCGVRASVPPRDVLLDGGRMPGARWFVGARLNYADNLLRHHGRDDALVFWGENGDRRRLSRDELRSAVGALSRSMREAGVAAGDRIAGFMPNLPETVIAMLSAASLGALWSSCSPDFGLAGVLDRFGQIAPKVLFTADGYLYGGKSHQLLPRVREIVRQIPSVSRVVVASYLGRTEDLAGLPGAARFEEMIASGGSEDPRFEQLPFEHPLFVMYSSGTTGLPKCMVHSGGGTLIQHLKEHVLHCDLRAGDRIFYFTTCGWMMWNWLVSALATGAAVMLYDGSPFSPDTVLWDYAQSERFTVFGTSARYIASMEKAGLRPALTHDLDALRLILSTGSPLAPESFDYVDRDVKPGVQLSSISGGTDIISCFALGNPVLPVRRGELQCRGLGMRVEVYDEAGRPVLGRKGELVCTAPFPSMPVEFWSDPDGSRFRAAYFERYPGVWHHGDYVELRPGGGLLIHGRSDAVLNPGGVRIGTAEIYRVVEKLPEVRESLAVGQEWKGDVRLILFVLLREGLVLDVELEKRIREVVRAEASPRHVPAKIIQAPAMPRTLSGKLVELAVREAIHGRPVGNTDALANPEALDFFRDLPQLAED
jgi:acetoacetyl-CoA synthetase